MTFKLESRIEELEKGRRDTDAENIKRDIEIYELKAKIAKLRCIQIAKEILNEKPIIEYHPSFLDGLELDAFFQKY
ncbi:hypothetical protein GLOIN_2v1484053 [Rhizophagus irregularis DAOM 181602=DAOM 197198]|uniref:Uncharacterized protein n=2 Tax=Rhizophagus irregularis TaxID=588596 RepID=A0A015MU58_RHIIW|nr:hypothetical protein RirG_088760 [Rhizophagus irregularis DAOM 197198w]EXX79101.1 hypothetical protein RirG_008840 [Rhizophagus irregularis DAOM 197198w]GBC43553.1 hypothetical protein GLOIN_2v1484053 [Rhizophagus irregularis DAOM 181602=DAOM 197198]CAB5155657.1 unnamed protein product [Rhizophagus irregularis]CAG8687310.1 7580_t:CDS:2 [Rhizophagus irregularis]